MFPLSAVLFPGGVLPLHVFEPRYRAMTADCLAGEREIGVVLIARGSEVGGGDVRTGVGTVARIEAARRFDDGRLALVAAGTTRLRVAEWLEDDPYPRAVVDVDAASVRPGVEPGLLARAEGLVRRSRALLSELGQGPALPAELDLGDGAEERLWRLCDLAPLSALDRQTLLEADGATARADHLVALAEAAVDDLTRLLAGAMGGEPGAS